MKKNIFIAIPLVVILAAVFAYFAFFNKKQEVIAPKQGMVVNLPQANQEISSPLKIAGYVNGNGWIGFEGQVGVVKLLDSNGNVISQGILTATSEWTALAINFQTNLEFSVQQDQPGTLIFINENPSGDPAKDKTFVLPIKILAPKGETMTVKVFFNNNNLDPEISCNKVFSVERIIPKTTAVGKVSIEELLKGPADSEKNQGFSTSINSGAKLQSLAINNGVATADFDSNLDNQVGGSCRVSAIRAQITETLKQFPTIKSVIISINGRTEDILQP